MEKSQSRRYTHDGSSPRILRSKSGSTAVAATSSSLTQTSIHHSKREAKKMKVEEAAARGSGFVRFLPRSTSKVEVPRRTRSASTSPSAWALSPGRSSSSPAPPPVPRSPAGGQKLVKREVRSGMSGVLKYFKPKKVSPLLEEEYHQFRVAYNRLLQWRFANARAQASMAAVNRVAQGKVLNGWVRISVMRKIVMEKRSESQKMKQDIKVYNILRSEMGMLNEWWRIEARNLEAVGRVVRKLSAISLCLPLHQNAEEKVSNMLSKYGLGNNLALEILSSTIWPFKFQNGDVMSVYDAVSTATEVMDNIKSVITDMYCQVEKTCFLLTEFSVMLKQYKQFFQELEKPVALVASLEAEEKSLRVHHIQLVNEVK